MTRNLPVLAAFSLVACGGPLKFDVASTPKAPGADAHIVADVKEKQNQTDLEVTVKNLAPPDRVTPGAAKYVAWYRKDANSVWARVGGLDYDADNRGGSFKGSAPERAFDFEVTAEKTESPASPSSDVVLNQRISE